MKSKVSVAVVILAIICMQTSDSLAQTKFGLTGGINYTSVSGDAPEEVSYSKGIGMVVGLTGEFYITKDIKFNFQPRYVQRNGKIGYDVGEDEPLDSFKTKLNYFSLPLIVKVPAITDKTFFNGGIDLAYLLNAERVNISETGEPNDIKSALNEFDVAFLVGFGISFPVQKHFGIDLEARYMQSVSNLSKNNTFQGSLPARFRSSGFQLLTNIYYILK